MMLTLLAEAAPTPAPSLLPDPHSPAALGWLLIALSALFVAVNQAFTLVKNVIPKLRGGGLGRAELDEILKAIQEQWGLKLTDVGNRITDLDRYTHSEVHKLIGEVHGLSTKSDAALEGLHNRLFQQAETLNYLRGSIEGLKPSIAHATANATEQVLRAIRELPAAPPPPHPAAA